MTSAAIKVEGCFACGGKSFFVPVGQTWPVECEACKTERAHKVKARAAQRRNDKKIAARGHT